MVKLTQPLGSESARGALGRTVIYQGQTAKIYRAPKVSRLPAQTQARDIFQSSSKILKMLKPWGRAWLLTMLGNNWFSVMTGHVASYWSASNVSWGTFAEQNKQEWRDNSPYESTLLDTGLAFFATANALLQVSTYLNYDLFGVAPPEMTTSAATRTFWDKPLDHVFGSGIYDDTNSDFGFEAAYPAWSYTTDANAYGGGYRLSASTGPAFISFYIFGSRLGVIYKQLAAQSICYVILDNMSPWTFSQNDAGGLSQVEWTSPVFAKGLHAVTILRSGAAGAINIDGIRVYG